MMISILIWTWLYSILLLAETNSAIERHIDGRSITYIDQAKQLYPKKGRNLHAPSPFVPSAAPTSKESKSPILNEESKNVIGLQNLGNTCYLNAQIQCLYHIPFIRNLIVSNDECTTSSPAYIGLRQLFIDMNQSQFGRAVAPTALCQLLDIPLYEQQDTQEFWKLLLPALEIPEITELYTGTYENYIVAMDGSNRERRFLETFLDLSLDISPLPSDVKTDCSVGTSVMESLQQQFNQPELLSVEAGNGWRPSPDASDKVDAHKGYRLIRQGLPSILQLHLKRFHFDWTTETTIKLNQAVAFPLTLDLTSIVSPTDEDHDDADSNISDDCCYELQSVIVHVGEYHSGHYYSYVRPDVRTDDWYRLNDEIHAKVRLIDVMQDAIGGIVPMNHQEMTKDINNGNQGNFVGRFFRGLFGMDKTNAHGYGYGGPKSNAYVLQYIRKSAIRELYTV